MSVLTEGQIIAITKVGKEYRVAMNDAVVGDCINALRVALGVLAGHHPDIDVMGKFRESLEGDPSWPVWGLRHGFSHDNQEEVK